jgi:allophanate hydrolase
MSETVLSVSFAGPYVSIQDAGRRGFMRFGVPASGPMDRAAFAAANVALGNDAGHRAIEISMGGLMLQCVSGAVTFAVAGGGFIIEHGERRAGSWTVATLRAGERMTIRPGHWGSWTYLAFAGNLAAGEWLGSASTHALSGLGGGKLVNGQTLAIADSEIRAEREGAIPCPVSARPNHRLHVVPGPQDRFFAPETMTAFLAGPYLLTGAYDRMGVRLQGPELPPRAPLDMPSEPIVRGSVQVAGDGVATVLLADHQTTGGYPKIATVIDTDLDAFVQLRPRDMVAFHAVTPERAVELARMRASSSARYFAALAARAAMPAGMVVAAG